MSLFPRVADVTFQLNRIAHGKLCSVLCLKELNE